jgi:hypothetical protein
MVVYLNTTYERRIVAILMMYVRNLLGVTAAMLAEVNEDEITYGPKKFSSRDLMVSSGLTLVGVFMIWSGKYGQAYVPMSTYLSAKLLFMGVFAVVLGIAGAVLMINGKRRNVPHVTMNSKGLSYTKGLNSVFEARWDCVGPFELVYDSNGKLDSIQAPMTGENIGDNLQKDDKFGIYSLKLLDVEPAVLVSELNQVRANALSMRD